MKKESLLQKDVGERLFVKVNGYLSDRKSVDPWASSHGGGPHPSKTCDLNMAPLTQFIVLDLPDSRIPASL